MILAVFLALASPPAVGGQQNVESGSKTSSHTDDPIGSVNIKSRYKRCQAAGRQPDRIARQPRVFSGDFGRQNSTAKVRFTGNHSKPRYYSTDTEELPGITANYDSKSCTWTHREDYSWRLTGSCWHAAGTDVTDITLCDWYSWRYVKVKKLVCGQFSVKHLQKAAEQRFKKNWKVEETNLMMRLMR